MVVLENLEENNDCLVGGYNVMSNNAIVLMFNVKYF